MRQQLLALGAVPMVRLPHSGYATTAGFVVAKQRPPTAKGFTYYILEDGPLRLQVVISPNLWERSVLRASGVLIVSGLLEKRGRAWTLRADTLVDAGAEYAKIEAETV